MVSAYWLWYSNGYSLSGINKESEMRPAQLDMTTWVTSRNLKKNSFHFFPLNKAATFPIDPQARGCLRHSCGTSRKLAASLSSPRGGKVLSQYYHDFAPATARSILFRSLPRPPKMPQEVSDIKKFIEICRRKDASCKLSRSHIPPCSTQQCMPHCDTGRLRVQ